jgi:hypothetical protein
MYPITLKVQLQPKTYLNHGTRPPTMWFNATSIVRCLLAQGFASLYDLRLASESDLDLIARSIARTPPRGTGNGTKLFIALKNLKGFRFWADERRHTSFEANAESFTNNLVTEFTVRCQEY